MNTELGNFYTALLIREGRSPLNLTAPWGPADARGVVRDFRRAFCGCAFARNPLVVPVAATNQSVGHRVANFLSERMNLHLRDFKVEECPGNGYPDRRLVRLCDQRAFALELKATSLFKPHDLNRVVLTSKSEKLRRWFEPPINHVLLLVAYERDGEQLWLRSGRLAFLDPSTRVQVRLEASLSHKFMSVASRTFVWASSENGGVVCKR